MTAADDLVTGIVNATPDEVGALVAVADRIRPYVDRYATVEVTPDPRNTGGGFYVIAIRSRDGVPAFAPVWGSSEAGADRMNPEALTELLGWVLGGALDCHDGTYDDDWRGCNATGGAHEVRGTGMEVGTYEPYLTPWEDRDDLLDALEPAAEDPIGVSEVIIGGPGTYFLLDERLPFKAPATVGGES